MCVEMIWRALVFLGMSFVSAPPATAGAPAAATGSAAVNTSKHLPTSNVVTEQILRRPEIALHSREWRAASPTKLKDLESELKATIDKYIQRAPELGDKDEEEVSKFYYTLEPVFALKNSKPPKGAPCEKAKHDVELEDRMGRPDSEPLTADAEEAMAWLKVLCD